MPIIKTADIVDLYDDEVDFCHVPLRLYGGRRGFHGRVVTLKTFEDNALLRRCLEQPGKGKVLVVDGGASTRVALVGDKLAEIAQNSEWAGLVLNAAIRDVTEINALDFGILALGSSPKKSGKAATGAVDVPVSFGGVRFMPGHYLYADEDGLIVAHRPVHLPKGQ